MKAKIKFLSVPSKFDLVKLIKENFKLGLKESKDIVDIGTIYFDKEEAKYVNSLPEINLRDLSIFTSKLDDLKVKYTLEIIKSDKKTFIKKVEALEDVGKYVIVSTDLIIKLIMRNRKKDEEIKNLKNTISSLEEKIRDLESRKYDHLTIIQELENIIKRY